MSLDLEWAVSQAVTRVHALERALHDSGPWSIQVEGFSSPAERTLRDDRIVFSAPFVGCWEGGFTATLYCGPDPLLTKRITLDEQGDLFFVDWAIGISDPVRA